MSVEMVNALRVAFLIVEIRTYSAVYGAVD